MKVRILGRGQADNTVGVLAMLVICALDAEVPDDLDLWAAVWRVDVGARHHVATALLGDLANPYPRLPPVQDGQLSVAMIHSL
jgi:hypothetical protein